ncbi:MAG: hypothetical protein WDW36_001380 [Sanguina aurantia]
MAQAAGTRELLGHSAQVRCEEEASSRQGLTVLARKPLSSAPAGAVAVTEEADDWRRPWPPPTCLYVNATAACLPTTTGCTSVAYQTRFACARCITPASHSRCTTSRRSWYRAAVVQAGAQ